MSEAIRLKRLKVSELWEKYYETDKLLKRIETAVHVRAKLMYDCRVNMLDGILRYKFNIDDSVKCIECHEKIKCVIGDVHYCIFINHENKIKILPHDKETRLVPILQQFHEMAKTYQKYGRLIFLANYMECITFLLCRPPFPKDILKLIANKILFFSFFVFSFFCFFFFIVFNDKKMKNEKRKMKILS